MSEEMPSQEIVEGEEVEKNPVDLEQLLDEFENKKDGEGDVGTFTKEIVQPVVEDLGGEIELLQKIKADKIKNISINHNTKGDSVLLYVDNEVNLLSRNDDNQGGGVATGSEYSSEIILVGKEARKFVNALEQKIEEI